MLRGRKSEKLFSSSASCRSNFCAFRGIFRRHTEHRDNVTFFIRQNFHKSCCVNLLNKAIGWIFKNTRRTAELFSAISWRLISSHYRFFKIGVLRSWRVFTALYCDEITGSLICFHENSGCPLLIQKLIKNLSYFVTVIRSIDNLKFFYICFTLISLSNLFNYKIWKKINNVVRRQLINL